MVRKDYEKLFTNLVPPEPPAGLLDKILARIRYEERFASLKKRVAFWSLAVVGSLVAAVPAVRLLGAELAESGLPQTLYLLFSDTAAVIAYFGDFALSVVESLPVMGIAMVLSITLILLVALKMLARDITIVASRAKSLRI